MGTMFVATGTPLTNVRLKVSLQLYLITPASDIVQLRTKGFLLGARASGQISAWESRGGTRGCTQTHTLTHAFLLVLYKLQCV